MRAPDVTGPFGRAWVVKKPIVKPDHNASLSEWLINVPGAHPFWEYWYIALIHLRDIPGVPPAHKKYPEAEFEFIIAAISPEVRPAPDPDEARGFPLMTPTDVAEQFHGITDHDAVRVCEAAVQAIVNGRISPDQDFRSMWHQLLARTVEHFREGKHPEN